MEGDEYDVSQPAPNRCIDVELSGQEIITIDLDALDSDPLDYIELLREANARVPMWTKLACEYWRNGLLDAAQQCIDNALKMYQSEAPTSLAQLYQLQANLQIARARKAPKVILDNARQDNLSKEEPKDRFLKTVTHSLNLCGFGKATSHAHRDAVVTLLSRGIFHLAKTELDEALRNFDQVLKNAATNVVALLGKARILFAQKQYPQSLRLYQQVLQLNPNAQPDPRIGIGLCFWAMNQKEKAKMCWERSLEVNSKNWASYLLLGLEAINRSKKTDDDDDDRMEAYIRGTKLCEQAFKLNNRNAAAANALFDVFLQRGDKNISVKLAERTIQFAETLALFGSGHIHAGRLTQMQGSLNEAHRHFNAALKSNPKNSLAAIGLAQVQLQNDEIPAAIHTLDSLMQPPNPQKCLEATVMLASLRAFPRVGLSSADAAAERAKARELFENVLKVLDLAETPRLNGSQSGTDAYQKRKAFSNFGDDLDLFIEAGRLWQDDEKPRVRLLEEAVRVAESRVQAGGPPEPRLLNNLAVLKHNKGEFKEARSTYEAALTEASSVGDEGMATTILYNLGRLYEDQGEANLAKQAYKKLLKRHPEYADAKVRQAHLLICENRFDDAHELLKASLMSQKYSLNARSAMTHFYITQQQFKVAKEFTALTLKDHHGSHDAYSLCAAAWVFFNIARENRDPQAAAERKKNFVRAAEAYERALHYDPKCAIAAQGLAILAAEDALGSSKVAGTGGSDEAMRKIQGAREALDIFGKVRESLNDPSVYINIGHCHFVRDEFGRAIESYETAKKKCTSGSSLYIVVLQSLCRAWYSQAIKDQSFAGLQKALSFAQKAAHIAPQQKSNIYNIAMIGQKATEILISTPPGKRSLPDLKRAVEHGIHAHQLFTSLAADKSPSLPYSKEIADQRRKYGESLLRKADEQVSVQEQHEQAQEARLAEARQRRTEEKERVLAAERAKIEEHQKQAEALMEARRKAREEAMQWSAALAQESDEEKEKKAKKGKRQREREREKDREPGAGEGELSAEEALFSGEDGDDRPKKRSLKKRVVRDDDEDEEATAAPRKKQFKSKETISDSDEEMP